MSIEFTCLSCRHRVVADDADVGERVDCPECGLTLKVPAPIGGRLTQKRIPPQDTPPLLLSTQSVSGTAPGGPPPSIKAAKTVRKSIPVETQRGFALDYMFDGLLGRDEEDAAAEVMEQLIQRFQRHFVEHGNYYGSCGLLLVVHNYSVEEVVVQLQGSVNFDVLRFDARYQQRHVTWMELLLLGPLRIAARDHLDSRSVLNSVSRVERSLAKTLLAQLDAHVDRPRSWWT